MIIIPPNHTIKAQIEDAVFWLSPLTSQQRQEIIHYKKTKAGEVVTDVAKMTSLALKYGLKKATGLKTPDGKEFKLKFGSDGTLCEEHCDLLIDSSAMVHSLALKLSQGISIQTGPGVTVTYEGPSKKKSRQA